jgi:hypothetical protein
LLVSDLGLSESGLAELLNPDPGLFSESRSGRLGEPISGKLVNTDPSALLNFSRLLLNPDPGPLPKPVVDPDF